MDCTVQILEDWVLAITLPIYKKVNQDLPANYRHISHLRINKLYEQTLIQKISWLDCYRILEDNQVRHFIYGYALMLQHLAKKYTPKTGSVLYTAFIDF